MKPLFVLTALAVAVCLLATSAMAFPFHHRKGDKGRVAEVPGVCSPAAAASCAPLAVPAPPPSVCGPAYSVPCPSACGPVQATKIIIGTPANPPELHVGIPVRHHERAAERRQDRKARREE
jgi:hypothetical protein